MGIRKPSPAPTESNRLEDFLSEVDRRRQTLQTALCGATRNERVTAVATLGDVLVADTLDPLTGRLRALADDVGRRPIQDSITLVCNKLGNCVSLSIASVPEIDSSPWQAAWGELNQAIHELRSWESELKRQSPKQNDAIDSLMATATLASLALGLRDALHDVQCCAAQLQIMAHRLTPLIGMPIDTEEKAVLDELSHQMKCVFPISGLRGMRPMQRLMVARNAFWRQ